MSKLILTFTTLLLLVAQQGPAATSTGRVLCDADQNGAAGVTDPALAGVLVVVTNSTGTYSNAVTTAPDGSFYLSLPDAADTYVEYLDPSSLPADSSVVIPPNGAWYFQVSPTLQSVSADFLVQSGTCQPLPVGCWLSGNGSRRSAKGKPEFHFTASANPDCPSTTSFTGSWMHQDKTQNLQFRGTVQQLPSCGTVEGSYNHIEVTGTGSLKGVSGNRASYGDVLFTARVEDRSAAGEPDRYYLRVYDATGRTLLLVSGDPANPANVVPLPLDSSHLQVRFGTCENPPR